MKGAAASLTQQSVQRPSFGSDAQGLGLLEQTRLWFPKLK